MNKALTIYEVEEVGKVITYMKTEKTITDISEANGISTITSNSLLLLNSINDTYLKVGQIVTINKINYPVLSVNLSAKTFTITATGLYTVLTVAPFTKTLLVTKWNLAINYLYGSHAEVNQILANAQKDPDKMLIRFPLFWLFLSNSKKYNPWDNIDFNTKLKFSLVHLTDKNYTASTRLTNVFKPVLQPLLELFLDTITSPYFKDVFHFETFDFEYEKYDRYFYGSADKNVSILDAPTDAIEISMDFNLKKQY